MVVARAGLCGQVLSALDGTMRCAEVGMKPVLPLAGLGLGVGIGDGWIAGPTWSLSRPADRLGQRLGPAAQRAGMKTWSGRSAGQPEDQVRPVED